jgi:hypothetical protein
MDKGPSQAEINKEFTCSNNKCKKKCDEVWSFTNYGGEARKQEYLKGTSYCEECFKKKEEELK